MRSLACSLVAVLLLQSVGYGQTKKETIDVAEINGFRFTITATELANVHGETRLRIGYLVQNVTKDRKIDFHGFKSGKRLATLVDDVGNKYKLIPPIVMSNDPSVRGYEDKTKSVYPRKGFSGAVVFERPIGAAKSFTLKLPGEAFDTSGSISLVFDRSAIVQETPKKK